MTSGIDILLTLTGIIISLEVVLYLFRGTLLRLGDTERLQRQAGEAQEELRQAKERSKLRETDLAAARDEAEAGLAVLRQASRDLADAQVPREVLVHKLGDPADGARFRAPLRKMLPDTAEDNQVRLWSYDSFVDVWARSPAHARDIAERQYAAKAGYVIGPFAPVAPAADPARAQGVAA